MKPTGPCVQAAMRRLFAEKGLPEAIRSDNGPPFGSNGPGGLSRLSVWWLKLGVEPHYIRPSSPQDNGRHERMHRTLREQTAQPPAQSKAEQQKRFDAFCRHYNEERPHEALTRRLPLCIGIPHHARCRSVLQTPGTTPTNSSAGFAGAAPSSGREKSCSSAKRSPERWSAWRSLRTATIS